MSRAHGAQLGRDQQIDLLKSIRYGPLHSPTHPIPHILLRETYQRNKIGSPAPSETSPGHKVSSGLTIGVAAIESNDEFPHDELKDSRHGKRTPNISQIRDSL